MSQQSDFKLSLKTLIQHWIIQGLTPLEIAEVLTETMLAALRKTETQTKL